jgi:hypothetical protein
MMLVLKVCRMQEFQGCGGFHQDFKGKSGRTGNMQQGQHPYGEPLRGWCVKLQGRSQSCNGDPRKLEIPETWNICMGKYRQHQSQPERGHLDCNKQSYRGRNAKTLGSSRYVITRSRCWTLELQYWIFALWVLVLLWSHPFFLSLPFWNGNVCSVPFYIGSV